MGAVSYLPYAHTKTGSSVAVWDGAHRIIDRTTGANVTCVLERPNGRWYKLVTPADLVPGDRDGVPTTGRYMNASLMDLLSIPDGYPWGTCSASSDQPGFRLSRQAVLVTSTLVALAGLVVGRQILRRRRSQRVSPPAP